MDAVHHKNNESSAISTLRFLSQFICHRIPERTFQIKGHYFPVCSRCTGIYLGAFSYFIYAFFFYIDYNFILILSGFLMVIPTTTDGLTQLFSSRESSNILRFATGLFAGIGFAILLKAFKWLILFEGGI